MMLGLAFGAMACTDDDQDVEPVFTGEIMQITVHVIQDTATGEVDKGSKDISTMNNKVSTVTWKEVKTDKETNETTSKDKESTGIRVSDIIQAALGLSDSELDDYLKQYKCRFESNVDGVTSEKKACGNYTIPCTSMKHAYFGTEDGQVFYDENATFLDASGAAVPKETWQGMGCFRTGFTSDDKAGDNATGGKLQAIVRLMMTAAN